MHYSPPDFLGSTVPVKIFFIKKERRSLVKAQTMPTQEKLVRPSKRGKIAKHGKCAMQ
jgi:hypothetical protein